MKQAEDHDGSSAQGRKTRLTEFRVRPYRASDLDALHQLDQICFLPGVSYSRAEIARYLRRPDAKSWVVEATGEPAGETAGFVIVSCGRRQQGHIITLDVAPSWRRRAVGSMLMDTAEKWIAQHGGTAVFLETAEDNLTAQAFYLRRGYARLGRIEDYYGRGEAAWLMGKRLGE